MLFGRATIVCLAAALLAGGCAAKKAESPGAAPTAAVGAETRPASRHPYATPVEGRPGLVISPHAPEAGWVSVRDPVTGQPFATGTEVRCPFSGKIFCVP